MENHKVYKDNKKHNTQSKSVYYPAIDKQKYAEDIFQFIDDVRLASENNAFFCFDYSREIQDMLAKQWAGMIYDFLIERQKRKEIMTTNRLIENLTIATEKTEELIKNLLTRQIGEEDAKGLIDYADKEAEAKKFFKLIFNDFKFSTDQIKNILSTLSTTYVDLPWYEYLENTGEFMVVAAIDDDDDDDELIFLVNEYNLNDITIKSEHMSENDSLKLQEYEELFDSFKKLTDEAREKVLKSLLQ